jgi:hypothetical protein
MARRGDAARYRKAGEAALQQVDACIHYLRRLQKRELAARLEKNRNLIARRLARR